MNFLAAKTHIEHLLYTQLPPHLHYHNYEHTQRVYRVCATLCEAEGIHGDKQTMVLTAALLHDCGFIRSDEQHEAVGCDIARELLPAFGYTGSQIEAICEMIMATKIPQSPQTLEAAILCDADLYYLGGSHFYTIGHQLFEELKERKIVTDEESWNRIQLRFLEQHQFFTQTARKLREPHKVTRLSEIREIVDSYAA